MTEAVGFFDMGNVVDSVISYISPSLAVKREVSRRRLDFLRDEFGERKYAAAKSGSVTGDWTPLNSNVNDVIASSWTSVVGRVSQLVRDFQPFSAAVLNMENFAVGRGFKLQSRVLNANGEVNLELSRRIEEAWKVFCRKENFDNSGKLSFVKYLRLMVRQQMEFGEALSIKVYNKKGVPFQIRTMEPLSIYDSFIKADNISQGVEFDKATLKPIAYYFSKGKFGESERITADNVIHNFKMVRSGQIRGMTPFAQRCN